MVDSLPDNVQSILRDSETVEWKSGTHKLAKMIESLFGIFLFFGFIAVIITLFAAGTGYFLVGLGIGVSLISLWTLLAIGEYMVGQTLHIATENRLIRYKEGVLDSEVEYIEWENVNQIETSKGIIDTIFSTGTVEVEGHKTDDVSVNHINDPYGATSTLESLRE